MLADKREVDAYLKHRTTECKHKDLHRGFDSLIALASVFLCLS